MGLPAIDELGRRIERAWRAADHERGAFPAICAAALDAARLPSQIDPDDIVRLALGEGELPPQNDLEASFGQPPVTLFRAARFQVAALFWVDGTTAIHDHAFSGAFAVLSGSSIETRFSFAPERDVDGHLFFGRLSVLDSALLRAGEVRPIPAGPGYIHSLFHLARPSVSLVVRTYWEPTPGLQLEYSPAGVASDSYLKDEAQTRVVQIVRMLRATDDARFEERVARVLAEADTNTALAVVRACAKITDERLLDRLLAALRDPEARARARAWLEHRRRLDFLVERRGFVQDADLRFMLAVLLNAQRRADALALAARHRAGVDPAVQVAAWLGELSRTTMRLQVGNVPWEPSVLGLPPFDAAGTEALVAYLRTGHAPEDGAGRAFLAQLRLLPHLAPLFAD